MKKIQVRMDYDHNLFIDGFLLDTGKDAIYVDENLVWIYGVKPLNDKEKYYKNNGGIIIAEIHNKETVDIEMIVKKMKSLSLYDYIINHFDRTHDINFEILNLN